jgi:hypothetical protein
VTTPKELAIIEFNAPEDMERFITGLEHALLAACGVPWWMLTKDAPSPLVFGNALYAPPWVKR